MKVRSHAVRFGIFATGLLLIFGTFYLIKKISIRNGIVTEGIVTGNKVHGINKSDFGSTVSAEIKYFAGDSLVTFPGPEGQPMKVGEIVPVIYLDEEKTDAQIYTFSGFWLHGLLWCLLPAIFWVAVCFSVFEVEPEGDFRA